MPEIYIDPLAELIVRINPIFIHCLRIRIWPIMAELWPIMAEYGRLSVQYVRSYLGAHDLTS